MVGGEVFIGAVIIAVTEAIKAQFPQVKGAVTVLVAALLGLVVALIDVEIGIEDLTIAAGILTGLGAAGVVTVAKKV